MESYYPKWNKKITIINGLIDLLYDLDDCSTGGLCHIVVDDENIKDSNLEFVIEYCQREENKDCVDKELSSLICQLLLELNLEQRAALFGMKMMCDIDYLDESVWEEMVGLKTIQEYINEFVEDDAK